MQVVDLVEVGYALEWLRLRQPDEAVKYADAVREGRKLSGHGGDRRSEKVKDQGYNITLKEGGDFQRGTSSAYLRARLDRDHHDILEALDRGEYPRPSTVWMPLPGLAKGGQISTTCPAKTECALNFPPRQNEHRGGNLK